jgi:hypothetical protein
MNSKWRVWRRSSYRVLPASRSAVTLSRSAWRSSNSACRRRNSCRTDMLGFDLSTRSARHMGRAMGSVSREPRIRGRRDGRADAPSRLATSAFRMLTSSSSSSSSLKISSSWLADRGFGAGAGTFAPASGSSILGSAADLSTSMSPAGGRSEAASLGDSSSSSSLQGQQGQQRQQSVSGGTLRRLEGTEASTHSTYCSSSSACRSVQCACRFCESFSVLALSSIFCLRSSCSTRTDGEGGQRSTS